ncbi:MAG: hypothetical protein ACLQMT_03515 [Candidatus Acidiferrales bacterium]
MASRNTHFALASMFAAALAIVFAAASIAVAAAPQASANPSGSHATITFRKVFKSSFPEFVEIKIDESGSGTFDIRQLADAANPQPFEAGAALVGKIFGLAAKLRDFDGIDLEVHHRLANLGEKTFRYEKGGEAHEVTFNYTLNPSASELLDIFEGLARQEQDLSDLVRTLRYDRLGVNDVLVQTDDDYTHNVLPEPQRLLGALDQAAADENIMDIARRRARELAARIRSASP